jgi:hypothetical protein
MLIVLLEKQPQGPEWPRSPYERFPVLTFVVIVFAFLFKDPLNTTIHNRFTMSILPIEINFDKAYALVIINACKIENNSVKYPFYFLANTYGCSTYGSQTYSTGTTCSSTASPGSSGSQNGSLANTGTAALIVVAVACALIVVGILVRFWRKRNKR